jgi:hypothetical protein
MLSVRADYVLGSLQLRGVSLPVLREEVESIFRIYLGQETLEKHRKALLGFAERVERRRLLVAATPVWPNSMRSFSTYRGQIRKNRAK